MTQRVSEVMTPDPVCVTPDTTLAGTARRMRDHDIGAVLVVDDGQLLGIVTDRDLVVRGLAGELDPATSEVGELTTPAVAVLDVNSPSSHAVRVMRQQRIRRLPVCDETGRPVGIVSLGDLAEHHDPGSALADISAAEPN
ncbi:CBS domain protein [Stackebrandtia albiflava]|uniref:CBS domain protein n=1 Tax=Stackebrandtia albiflava TaxID=406432 RepID=A0A562V3T4_9ACTN|nr:CBS domain-containing protein [Stackebrandtia albiflava]TWJ12544.1 CBS domain protein [Stackebrandtia albiflava]